MDKETLDKLDDLTKSGEYIMKLSGVYTRLEYGDRRMKIIEDELDKHDKRIIDIELNQKIQITYPKLIAIVSGGCGLILLILKILSVSGIM